MTNSALARCVGDPAAFVDGYWGRRSLLVPGSGRHSDLISVRDLDALLARSLLPTAAFRLVREGQPIPEKRYSRKFGGGRSDPTSIADPALIWDEFYDGATIVLEGLHRYWRPLADLCRDLESELGHPTQVNAYITPPGSQGFSRHVDEHDVFVLQIYGEKAWECAAEPGSDVLEPLTLRAGDCLYIPTACAHSARTSDSPSIHLTVGILVQTWGDLIGDLIALARTDPVFAERVPVERREGASVAALGKEAVARLQGWLERVEPAAVEAHLARRLLTTRHERHEGMLQQLLLLPQVDDRTEVTRVADATVSIDGDAVRLLLPDRELRFPRRLSAALDMVTAAERFRVADLGEHLDEPGRVAFVRRLIREGLLLARHPER